MKKVFYFTMMVMAVFVMAACSSSPSTPGDALKKYSGYLQSGDYENFVEGLAFDDSQDAAKVKEQKEALGSMLKDLHGSRTPSEDGEEERRHKGHRNPLGTSGRGRQYRCGKDQIHLRQRRDRRG